MSTYDRYSQFRQDGKISLVPFGDIQEIDSDKYIVYKRNKTRLDNISYKMYGDPNYAWLILQANPQYGSMEFEIPDASVLRIPYPLSSAIERYRNSIEKDNKLNK
jgi:hypothetical protein